MRKAMVFILLINFLIVFCSCESYSNSFLLKNGIKLSFNCVDKYTVVTSSENAVAIKNGDKISGFIQADNWKTDDSSKVTFIKDFSEEILNISLDDKRIEFFEIISEEKIFIKFSEEINDNTNEMYLFFYYNKDLNSFAYGRFFPNQIEKKEVLEILKSISFK